MAETEGVSGGWTARMAKIAPEQAFDLAADVESYPRFLPWCVAARVQGRDCLGRLVVDNVFGVGPLRLRFTSHAAFERPRRLEIVSTDGPFRRFVLTWSFEAEPGFGTKVALRYRMALRSALLTRLAGLGREVVERQAAQAFRREAARRFTSPASSDPLGPDPASPESRPESAPPPSAG